MPISTQKIISVTTNTATMVIKCADNGEISSPGLCVLKLMPKNIATAAKLASKTVALA